MDGLKDTIFYILFLAGMSIIQGIISAKKKKKAKAAKKLAVSDAVETVDSGEMKEDGEAREEFMSAMEEDDEEDLFDILSKSFGQVEAERMDVPHVEGEGVNEIEGAGEMGEIVSSGVEMSAAAEGSSSLGYESNWEAAEKYHVVLGSAPEQEGGEGLASRKAEALRVQAQANKASEEIEKSRSLGSEVLQNPRLAMVASFIMEPKFKRGGRYGSRL